MFRKQLLADPNELSELIPLHVPDDNDSHQVDPFEEDVKTYLKQANRAMANRLYGEVKRHCETILRYKRDHLDAKYLLGQVAVIEKDYVKAAGYYQSIRLYSPYDKDVLFKQDCENLCRSLFEMAEAHLSAAQAISLSSIPNCESASKELGLANAAVSAAKPFVSVSAVLRRILSYHVTVSHCMTRLKDVPIFNEVRESLKKCDTLPHVTVTDCEQGLSEIKRIEIRLNDIKVLDKTPLQEEVLKLSQQFHYYAACARYPGVSLQISKIDEKQIDSLDEAHLQALSQEIKDIIELINRLIQHIEQMGGVHQKTFDSDQSKTKELTKLRLELEKSLSDVENIHLYKICERGVNSVPTTPTTDSASALERLKFLEKLQGKLNPLKTNYQPAALLLSQVETRIASMKKAILEKRVGQLKEKALSDCRREYDIGDAEDERINRVITTAFEGVAQEITDKIVYAQDDLQREQANLVSIKLTHYYNHKKYLFCCASNVLQLSDQFENQAPEALRDCFKNKT